MGARLARYTDNSTYAKHAEETWEWLRGVGYINDDWDVYDGANVEHNCTNINKAQFSYNAAVLLQGAAFMYNYVSWFPPLPTAPHTHLKMKTGMLCRASSLASQQKKSKKTSLGCDVSTLPSTGD